MKERRERLTASNFGKVVKMRPTTSCHNTVVSILYPDSLDRIEAIRYGKEHEADAIEALNKILAKTDLHVEECGLFVDTDTGYLAGTPDGTVGKDALVEVKCPMKCKDTGIEDVAKTDSTFCLEYEENRIRLKKYHNYYYQIQGQLHVAKRQAPNIKMTVCKLFCSGQNVTSLCGLPRSITWRPSTMIQTSGPRWRRVLASFT